MLHGQPISVAEFDAAPAADAAAELLPCCASRRWVSELVAARPYRTLAALTAASDRALEGLSWPEIETALAAHPRIGRTDSGDGQEAAWSRQEQSAAASSDPGVQAALRETNAAYEDRFGHVFLICATGLSAEQILSSARERLTHDDEFEQEIVRRELTKIVRLRLAKAFS